MRTRLSIGTMFLVILSLIMTGCLSGKSPSSGGNGGSGSGGNGGNGSPSLQNVTVQPATPTVAPTDTQQFKAIGHYSDKSTKDVTNQSAWSSSDPTIATVDPKTGLATAVASGKVSITATFSGQTSVATLNVATLSSVGINPINPSINPNATQQFTAKANYSNGEGKDVTAHASWTSSDHSIATISPTGLATAGATPGKVTITATFGGDNASTTLTVIGITSVVVTPIGPAIGTTGTQQFKATANYNNNTNKDVTNLATWASTNSTTVASINSTGLATAIAAGQTEISATYQSVTGQTALDVTTQTFSNADLSGNYVISLTGVDSRGTWFLVGTLTATLNSDGTGKITGIVDSNTVNGVQTAQTVLGSYTVFPDGRGDLNFGSSVSGGASHSVRFVLTASKTVAQVIEFDTVTVSEGKLEVQTGSGSFSAGSFSGAYVFGQGGFVPSGSTPMAVIGTLTSDGISAITGLQDVNNDGTVTQNQAVTGSYTAPDATTGRFTAILNGANYVFYLVSSSKAYFMSADKLNLSPVLGGQLESQSSTPTLANASYVFLIDYTGTGQFHTGGVAGQVSLNAGTITAGEQDEGPGPTQLTVTSGTYTASGGGRYALCETIVSTCDRNFILYLASGSHFYMLRTDSGSTNVQMGTGDQQSAVTVASGTYGLRAATLGAPSTAEADLGLLNVPQGGCPICGIGDQNANISGTNTISSLTLSQGTISTPDGSGRGTIGLRDPSGNAINYVFYVVSGNKLIVVGDSPNTDGFMNLQ